MHLQLLDSPIANDPCYGGALFYGEPQKHTEALAILRRMRKQGHQPLSKIPHLLLKELDDEEEDKNEDKKERLRDDLIIANNNNTNSNSNNNNSSSSLTNTCGECVTDTSGNSEKVTELKNNDDGDGGFTNTCR